MKYYLCEICGNLVELVEEGGGELVCCGQPMKKLEAKETDEGREKHLPVIERSGQELVVRVGSIAHPMESGHYIKWIVIHYANKYQMIRLTPGSLPEATFVVDEDVKELKVYSYCNVHGLWVKK
jgi:superoxide reductase